MKSVCTAPISTRFELLNRRGEITLSDLAQFVGWTRCGRPDSARVSHTLHNSRVHYQTAVKLALALGLDPHEVGV